VRTFTWPAINPFRLLPFRPDALTCRLRLGLRTIGQDNIGRTIAKNAANARRFSMMAEMYHKNLLPGHGSQWEDWGHGRNSQILGLYRLVCV
jgi:hypothetical protein